MSSLISALNVQKYELSLPSSGQRIQYRPFLVKEEKLLLIASESKNESEIFNTVKQVVNECTFNQFDAGESPLIDLEYVFLKIRSKSIGEKVTPMIRCGKCSASSEISVDISDLETTKNSEHKKKIVLNENMIIEMRYPRFNEFSGLDDSLPEIDKATKILASCIEVVQTKNEVFHIKDIERSEVENFVLHLNQDQMKKLMRFIETMPKLRKEVEFECNKCKNKEIVVLEGLKDFF